VQVTAPAPQAAGRFLAVCPDVTELLMVIAVLLKTILSSICLCPNYDITEALQSEKLEVYGS
jgi:hypothetical protein